MVMAMPVRLALRCCHKLATVAVDASELCSFEYRGAVPEDSFLTVRGGGGFPYLTSCKVDICAVCVMVEATSTSEEELVKLSSFLRKFMSTKQLHLCSNLMGSCFVRLPAFPILRHLQLHGRVPHDHDHDPAAAAAEMSRILSQAPNLETLSLFFEVKRRHRELYDDYCYFKRTDADLLDAHHLHYNQYETLDVPVASVLVPACLGSRVRKINLLHYQGGRAQRTGGGAGGASAGTEGGGVVTLEGGGGARPMRLIAFVRTLAGAAPLGPTALVFILPPFLAAGGASAGEAAAAAGASKNCFGILFLFDGMVAEIMAETTPAFGGPPMVEPKPVF